MMEGTAEVKPENGQSSEDWFMQQLEKPNGDTDWLIQAVAAVAKGGRADRAEAWADLLQDVLSKRGLKEASIRLLSLRASWRGQDSAFNKACEATLKPLFQDRLGMAQLRSCGAEKGMPAAEWLRRLDVLMRLKVGSFCWERNWGLGSVKSIDEFALRVAIDFARKPGHQMSFAYAGEALQPVGPTHLMVRHRTEPAVIRALVEGKPDEVVRMALASFGPLTVVDLQERLVPELVAEADWKRFWDAARKELKKEGLVEIPVKRTEPMRLLSRASGFDSEWSRKLLAERDLEKVLGLLQTLVERGDPEALDAESKAAVQDRVAFVMKGATGAQPDIKARGAVLAARLGPVAGSVDLSGVTAELMSNSNLPLLIGKLRAKDLADVIAFLKEHSSVDVLSRLVDLIPALPLTALESVISFLGEHGASDRGMAVLKGAVAAHEAGPAALAWLCRHIQEAVAAGIRADDVLAMALGVLNESHSGEALRARNQIESFFVNRAWVERVFTPLDEGQRGELLKRMGRSGNWDISSRRSAMANVIRAFPSLERLLAQEPGQQRVAAKVRVTSWRSYAQRQAQLKHLVEVEIPKNSAEIANARAYGDLSENFEYKAAKDNQRVLMQRQLEFESDLREVQGSDLKPAVTDRACVGTCVTVMWDGDGEERFNILGEWDREESLGIISNRSQMGQTLEGLAVGAGFQIGTEVPRRGKIVAIAPVSEEVQKWIKP
jgi:transcription elongation GreA/GreB family factor